MDQSLNIEKVVSKEKLLSRQVIYDGREIALSDIATIEFLDNLEDSAWLQKLETEKKFTIKKSNSIFDDKYYIERYVKLNFTIRKSEAEILAHSSKIIILSSKAGMGKSTLLPSLCNKIRNLDPSSWTEIIKLTDHVQDLPLYHTYDDDPIDFLSRIILKHDSFSSQLFKHQLKAKKNAVLMFDAFDEISFENRKILVGIIRKLEETNIRQIWITTRPYREYLEWQLSVRAWKLVKFSEDNQLDVLKNYWTKMGSHILPHIDSFAKSVVEKMDQCKVNICIPLHTQMVAEYFLENYLNEDKELPSDFSRHQLYTNIIQRKYSSQDSIIVKYNEIHEKLAMELLCPKIIPKYNLEESEMNIINAIGIATVSSEEIKICFVHKTYAEYFVAQFVFNQLNDDVDSKILDILVQKIISQHEFTEVKKFLNSFLYGKTFSELFLIKVRDVILKYIKDVTVKHSCSISFTQTENNNLIKIIYGAIKLLEPEDLVAYRIYFPHILYHVNDFKNDLSFLEMVIEENSEVMRYQLNFYYLQNILNLDSVGVLDVFLKALVKQYDNKEIRKYFLIYTKSYDFTKASNLFFIKTNCFYHFLNFLKEQVTPVDEFKKLLIIPNKYWHTCIYEQSEEKLLWFDKNIDNDFYNLLVRLRNSPTVSESVEDRFNYYYNEVINSKLFDEIKFTQDMLIKASMFLKYDKVPAGILLDKLIVMHSQCLKTKENLTVFQLDSDEMFRLTKRIRYGDVPFVVKIIRFILTTYYSNMSDYETNLLEFENLVVSFDEDVHCQYELIRSFDSMRYKMDVEKYGES